MKIKCKECKNELSEKDRIKFSFCEAYICDKCNYVNTLDELGNKSDK